MLIRNCPKCNAEIRYKSVNGYNNANINNSYCRKCSAIKSGFIDKYATFGKNTGSNNPFYGKKHTKEVKKKLSDQKIGSKLSEATKKKLSNANSGSKNSMYGISVYEKWLHKYGKEIADKKMISMKKKQSFNKSGDKNPMYGRKSPTGSGNGWKGWYKNSFFRSLRELTFMLELEESKTQWVSAENIRIAYTCPMGKSRTYSPDFLIGNKLIEIKPKRLQKTQTNIAKTKAAIEYCESNNLIYEIIDVNINSALIDKYYNDIKFINDYKERYERWKNLR